MSGAPAANRQEPDANILLVSSTAMAPPSAMSVVPLTIDDSSDAKRRVYR